MDIKPLPIQPILKRIAAGDADAFADVVRHYQRPLFGFLGRMAISQGQAEEIAQEAFLRAWQNLADYRPDTAAFSTWLFSIARNLALNELSRAASQREVAPHESHPEPVCERLEPPDALARSRQRKRLHAALRGLPLSDRSALALAYVHEIDLAAAAKIEGCSIGAIKTRLHRAKEKLRILLEEIDG